MTCDEAEVLLNALIDGELDAVGMMQMEAKAMDMAQPGVTQKAFDDFHLYDLNRTVALSDGETKQVQFIEAANVSMRRSYLYDGLGEQMQPIYAGNVNQNQGYGLGNENTKVLIDTPDQAFAEFEATAVSSKTGRSVHQLFFARLVAENGKIKLFREALNTVEVARANVQDSASLF